MSLKRLTSDVDLYTDYLEHLDSLISAQQKNMELMTEPTLIFRAQGAIAMLRKLKQLRETLNGKHS